MTTKLGYNKKKLSKLYYSFNPFVPTAPYEGALKLAEIAEKTPTLMGWVRKNYLL